MMMQIKFLGELLILNILSRQRTGKMRKLEKHTQPQPAQSLHHSYVQILCPFTRRSQTMTYIMHQNKNSVHLYYVYQG